MKAFHIVHWDTLYETANSRKVLTLTYYQKPNKLVGEGIGATLAHPKNVALLGTWALIEALASGSPAGLRGWLVRGGSALTAQRMANLTRVDVDHFTLALDHFCRPEIGWLEYVENGKLPGDSPTNPPPLPTNGKLPGDSPTNPPQEEGRGSLEEKKKREEWDALTRLCEQSAFLSPLEVKVWAAGAGVPLAFVVLKLEEGIERGDFGKAQVRKHWKERFERFWKQDGTAWAKKFQKNAAGAAGRPDGWKEGDADHWWTDSVDDLKGTLHGAVMGQDEKTAARLREIIALKKGNR